MAFDDLLTLAASTFLVRTFSPRVWVHRLALITNCAFAGYGIMTAVLAYRALANFPEGFVMLGVQIRLAKPSIAMLLTQYIPTTLVYCLPLMAYLAASAIEKIRKRYSFGFIVETIDD